jgi:cystathionine beta-synthase
MPVYNTILDCIGRTPLVRLARVAGDCQATILGKAEMLNPGGSVKDRIGLAMIAAAERDGVLQPGATIIEATAGNTGVALAMVAAVRSYRCIFVMPEKMSREKEELLCAYGAEVIRTANASPGHPDNFQEVARRLANQNGWFWPDQFGNAANPDIHYRTTGPEIWADTDGKVDAFVCGVGTGGSLTGAGRYLKERNPNVRVILADPVGSALGGGESGSYLLEGIGQSVPPANFDATVMDEAIYVADAEAFQMARRLAREEGMLIGGAAGCAVVAAIRYGMRPENAAKIIVALLPDTGRNYLSKIYNDVWMQSNGFENGE